MLKYFLGVAAMVSMYYDNVYYATEAIAVCLVVFSLVFYKLVFDLVTGQCLSTLNFSEAWQDMWIQRMLHVLAIIALAKAGGMYWYVLMFVAPWMIINMCTDLLNSLVRMEILEYNDEER